jgi:hypothetical protein
MKNNCLALLGALVGGVLGYFAFVWIANQGFYAMVLPGGLLGLGAGVVKNKSIFIAIICGLAATALGVFTEWDLAPFRVDNSFGYFVAHLYKLKPLTLILIALGGLIGFWVPFRRREESKSLSS